MDRGGHLWIALTSPFTYVYDELGEKVRTVQFKGASLLTPNSLFFTSKLVFRNENWVTRLLHNQTALALQRRLHLNGMQMVILPMQI